MVPTCGAIYHCLNIIIQILSVAHLRKACTAAEQGLIPVKNKHSYHNIYFLFKNTSAKDAFSVSELTVDDRGFPSAAHQWRTMRTMVLAN